LPAGGGDGGLVGGGDGESLDWFAVAWVFVVGDGATERIGDWIEPEVFDASGVFSTFDEFGFDVVNGAREFVFVGVVVGECGAFVWRGGREWIGVDGGGHGIARGEGDVCEWVWGLRGAGGVLVGCRWGAGGVGHGFRALN